ncbi:hypothetical protein SAMN05192529_13515 [Arachidicoccus rhizosphaerae]|uniref:Uncharacterized protein n=1 Tax=Arachidicoccus rhizosphaerae TaxID=551991 RepID=A0A1H4CR96_9BACT|nr:hypothetical protein SAMN05192529_13515 [Arachidicoccus rhizosphaerae]
MIADNVIVRATNLLPTKQFSNQNVRTIGEAAKCFYRRGIQKSNQLLGKMPLWLL